MHVFLTGEKGIGKSMVIDKIIVLLKISPGGFRTYFGPDRNSPDKLLYMNSAAEPKVFHPGKGIALFRKERPPLVFINKFDTYGVALIRSAKSHSKLIIMDECGGLESSALLFQKEILDTLNGSKPVLGVVKMDSTGWTDRIRAHPKVNLITVTKENRNDLPSMLAEQLSISLSG